MPSLERREANSVLRNGGTTVSAGAQGVGGFYLLTLYGLPPEVAGALAVLWTFVSGVVGSWARDVIAAGPPGLGFRDLVFRFLSALGCLVLAIGLTGCKITGGPMEVQIWDTASLEVVTPIGSLCLGCYANTAPPKSATVIAESVESDVSLATGPVVGTDAPEE